MECLEPKRSARFANPVRGGCAISVAVTALLFVGPSDLAAPGEETLLNFNYKFTSETGTITTVPNPVGEISFSPLTLVEASRRNTIYEPIFAGDTYIAFGELTGQLSLRPAVVPEPSTILGGGMSAAALILAFLVRRFVPGRSAVVTG